MDLIHPAIPPLAILLGAGTLTLARYRAAPMISRISSPFDRYWSLIFACALVLGYAAILPNGPVASMLAIPHQLLDLIGVVFLGVGGGFLIVGLMLLFRRNEKPL